MKRDQAIELARQCARNKPESYFSEPFQPHEWVVDAILQASDLSALAKVQMSDAELLKLSRETGLREYLHGVGPNDAQAILRRFVDAVAVRQAQGAQEAMARCVTDAEIADWAERHDIFSCGCQLTDARCAFEDAESHYLTRGAEREAVPDGCRATIQEAIDCIADVGQSKGKLSVGTYRHIGSKLSALLTAVPHPPEGARVVPDGMTLVPSRFVELVRAAHRATHPRAAPQLIADAIEELTAPTLAEKER